MCLMGFGVVLYLNKPTVMAPPISQEPIFYTGELSVDGIGPHSSFKESVDEEVLVLRQNFTDHTDYLFFNKPLWEKYLNTNEDALPGNIISFEGEIIALDATAGNHYYEVVSTHKLTKSRNATQEEIENILKNYNFCEQDSDCATTYGKCPLGCWIAVNNTFLDVTNQIIDNFWNNQDTQCVY